MHTRRRRWLSPAATVGIILGLAVAADPGAAAAPSQVPVAKALAKRIATAKTTAGRTAVLIDLAERIRLGVVTEKGVRVVAGARNANRVFAYRFELASAAARYARDGATVAGADALRGQLAALGGVANGTTLTEADLAGVLSRLVTRARSRPRDPRALVPLVVDQLASRRKQNLAKDATPALDAIQRLLLVLDVAAGAKALTASSGAAVPLSGSPCAAYGGTGALALGLGAAAVGGKANAKAAHTALLSQILQVRAETSRPTSAWGPKSHPRLHPRAGLPLEITLTIAVGDDLPRQAVACGELQGVRFPAPGPIRNASVQWNATLPAFARLARHGTFTTSDITTDRTGRARLVLQPRDEGPIAGIGPYQLDQGVIAARVDVGPALGNPTGLKQGLLVPTPTWYMAYHADPLLQLNFRSHFVRDKTVVRADGDNTATYVYNDGGTTEAMIPLISPTRLEDGSWSVDGMGDERYTEGAGTTHVSEPCAYRLPNGDYAYGTITVRGTLGSPPGTPRAVETQVAITNGDDGRTQISASWAPTFPLLDVHYEATAVTPGCRVPEPFTGSTPVFAGEFMNAHAAEVVSLVPLRFTIADWDTTIGAPGMAGSIEVARKEYARGVALGVETTRFALSASPGLPLP